jgi:threonine dehydrogenase-like Zn-dependent dehydrogenase
MRAIVYNGEVLYKRDYPDPRPNEGEALVRVRYAGVCATDLEITKGYMGFKGVLGHEFSGVVEQCFDHTLTGRRVVGEINIGCGACRYCNNNLENHCPERSVLGIFNRDGAFAEYLTLPVKNLHAIPDSVSDEEAVFVEPLAAAFEIMEQVEIGPRKRVCVLGDGRLGLLVAQVLAQSACDLVVCGRHREKLSVLEALGIRTAVGTGGFKRDFDLVVDCTGSPDGIETAFKIIRPRGTVILKTTAARKSGVDLNSMVVDELTLIGSRCGPFSPAIEALASRSIDVAPLITKVFPLGDGVEAIEYASRKGVLKVLLRVE